MTKGTVKEFGMADKIGYMFGDFGNDFTFILSSMFLMKFYTDVMGVSGALVGFMMMVARFLDAFTDVTMGQIVDRSKSTAKGKFAPWILRMCGPVAVASFLMYANWFRDMPMGFKIFWMFFTYILWGSVFYTSINIPYGSMASAISAEPKHRAQLSSARSVGAALAATAIGVIFPLVVYYTDENGNTALSGEKMSMAAFWCSVGAIICYLLCYKFTIERVKMEQKIGRFSVKELLRMLVKNKALIGIVVSALFLLLATLSLSTMTAYVFPNYFGNIKAQSASSLISTVVTLVCATFTVKLAGKIGKKELSVIGCMISVVAFLILFFIQTKSVTVFIIFYAIAYVGQAFFSLVCWAMITDVIDDTEVRTGERMDGTIYSIYSFARKSGQAFAAGLSGGLLALIGYTAETQFDPGVVKGIYNITCLAPAIGFACVILALWFLYPLNKKKVEENAEKLALKYKK